MWGGGAAARGTVIDLKEHSGHTLPSLACVEIGHIELAAVSHSQIISDLGSVYLRNVWTYILRAIELPLCVLSKSLQ